MGKRGRLDELETAAKRTHAEFVAARDSLRVAARAAREAIHAHANVLLRFVDGTATQDEVDVTASALKDALATLAAVEGDLGAKDSSIELSGGAVG